jgi:hypothetical protein
MRRQNSTIIVSNDAVAVTIVPTATISVEYCLSQPSCSLDLTNARDTFSLAAHSRAHFFPGHSAEPPAVNAMLIITTHCRNRRRAADLKRVT